MITSIITNPQAHPTEAQLKLVKTTKAHQKIHSWLMANDPTFSERLALKAEEQANAAGIEGTVGLAGGGATHFNRVKKTRPKKGKQEAGTEQKPHKKYGVLVQGDRRVLYNLAQCCKPEYPDLIVGYVTRTKGVSIHRADCLIYQRIPHKEERSVEVAWDSKENQ